MNSFVRNENIKRFRELRDRTTNPTDRELILKLLAEEEAPDSRRPAEIQYAREQARPKGVLSKDNKQTAIDYRTLLLIVTVGILYCGLVIGVAWSFGPHL